MELYFPLVHSVEVAGHSSLVNWGGSETSLWRLYGGRLLSCSVGPVVGAPQGGARLSSAARGAAASMALGGAGFMRLARRREGLGQHVALGRRGILRSLSCNVIRNGIKKDGISSGIATGPRSQL